MFGRFFESSKKDTTSIGIHPQALISNLGIIKNHKNKTNNEPRVINNSPNYFDVFVDSYCGHPSCGDPSCGDLSCGDSARQVSREDGLPLDRE